MLKKPSRRFIVLLILLIAGAGLAYYLIEIRGLLKPAASADDSKTRRGAPPASVQVAKARTKDFQVWVDALGTVTSLNTITVHTRIDGELIRVNFKEGQLVKQGDLLAEIDPRPYQVTLSQAEATLARDKAILDNGKVDLERYRSLVAKEAAPRQQYETQVSLVDQYQATVKNDQATIEAAKLNLTYCRITSPISGRVGLRQVDPGNIVHAGDSNGIVTITQLEPISVIFSLPQDWLPKLQKRLNSTIPVQAYDRSQTSLISSGSVMSVDNQIDTTTGTIKIRARFDNRDGKLFPNQFVNARILMQSLPKVVVIPNAAVQTGAKGSFVYGVSEDRKVSMKAIELGPTDQNDAVVKAGLAADEIVVIDGADKLKEGSMVAIRGQGGPAKDAPGGAPGGAPKGAPAPQDKSSPAGPPATDKKNGAEDPSKAQHHHGDGHEYTPEEREKWRQRHASESKDSQ